MSSTMAKLTYEDAVADLDRISVENLKAGRITQEALRWAIKTAYPKDRESVYAAIRNQEWKLADVLNDLLEVAREEQNNV